MRGGGGGAGSGAVSWYHLQDLENEAQDVACVTQRLERLLRKNAHKRRFSRKMSLVSDVRTWLCPWE